MMITKTRFKAHALLMGERLNTRRLTTEVKLALTPLVLPCGKGVAVLMRFGAVVFFDVTEQEREAFLDLLLPELAGPYERPLQETLEIKVEPAGKDSISGDRVKLTEAGIERLQLIADILAKNLILDHYEAKLAGSFDSIEPMAQRLHNRWRRSWRLDELTDQIGLSLLTEHRMVGRVEIKEKPELLWDHPELEGLYLRLFDEYELGERSAALEQKLELITRTIETLLRLEESRRSLRAEWYIIILIVVEILLSLYEMFLRH